jgi:hypothetical protein
MPVVGHHTTTVMRARTESSLGGPWARADQVLRRIGIRVKIEGCEERLYAPLSVPLSRLTLSSR